MQVLQTNEEVRRAVGVSHREGASIGLVPTMGYLHAGHMALVARARAECDRVAVSLFVNPTQFGPGEDLDRYPRDPDRDAALCREAGVDWLYTPSVSELYPHGPGTMVVPPAALTTSLCGAYRPGHFSGVATVVAKLFALWRPDRAYFGQKDFQQVVVIERLAEDLCFPLTVVQVPTTREPDGLAMSSRNVYLSAEERQIARTIPLALQAGWEAGQTPGATPAHVLLAARAVLAEAPQLSVQYLELVDPSTMAPAADLARPTVLALAAHLGRTRLIDNVSLAGPAPVPSPVS